MTRPETAGQALVAQLGRMLSPSVEWDESELVTLGLIENAADRLAVFRARFDAAARDPESSENRLATLSAEIRLLEMAIHRWSKSLDPGMVQAKSMRHVHAANVRWHGSAV